MPQIEQILSEILILILKHSYLHSFNRYLLFLVYGSFYLLLMFGHI